MSKEFHSIQLPQFSVPKPLSTDEELEAMRRPLRFCPTCNSVLCSCGNCHNRTLCNELCLYDGQEGSEQGSLCHQQINSTETEATAANRPSSTFTLIFPDRAIAVLKVHGANNQDEARAIACGVLPGCRYEVKDGDQSQGRAAVVFEWTCTQEQGYGSCPTGTAAGSSLLRNAEETQE